MNEIQTDMSITNKLKMMANMSKHVFLTAWTFKYINIYLFYFCNANIKGLCKLKLFGFSKKKKKNN